MTQKVFAGSEKFPIRIQRSPFILSASLCRTVYLSLARSLARSISLSPSLPSSLPLPPSLPDSLSDSLSSLRRFVLARHAFLANLVPWQSFHALTGFLHAPCFWSIVSSCFHPVQALGALSSHFDSLSAVSGGFDHSNLNHTYREAESLAAFWPATSNCWLRLEKCSGLRQVALAQRG